MNKKLPTSSIANELAGSSVFFQSSPKSKNLHESSAQRPRQVTASRPQATVTPRHHETTTSNNDAGKKSSTRDAATSADNEDTTAATLEIIRKTVRQVGKEAATHRFTAEEKAVLADIVYTYNRQGYKTSENEITRIAVNWLLVDYKERGALSVLARMLECLHG